jgi:hypothetical protein
MLPQIHTCTKSQHVSHDQLAWKGLHTVTGPGTEMVLHVHATSDTLGCANRPVLLKGPRAIDGGLVGAGRHGDIVSAAVGLEATLALRSAAGVVCAV